MLTELGILLYILGGLLFAGWLYGADRMNDDINKAKEALSALVYADEQDRIHWQQIEDAAGYGLAVIEDLETAIDRLEAQLAEARDLLDEVLSAEWWEDNTDDWQERRDAFLAAMREWVGGVE